MKTILYCILMLVMPLSASAELLQLNEAIAQAIAHSPDVKLLNEQVASAKAKQRQTLAPDNPSLSLQYNDEPSLTNPGGAGSHVVQITQPVAFPGKAFVNNDIAAAQVKALESQRNSMRLQVALTVKQAYYQLALARKNLELQKALKQDYEEILAIAKRRYEAGSIPQVDYLNAKVVLYAQENDVKDLESSAYDALTQLNILLDNPSGKPLLVTPLTFKSPPLIDKKAAEEKMLAHRAEIKAAEAQLEGSKYSYKLAKMSVLPDFQLTAGGTRYDIASASPVIDVSSRRTTYLIGVQMTIPLWAGINQRETINAADHDQNAARQNLESVIKQSRNNLSMTIDTIQSMESKLQNYQNHLIPLTQHSLKLALTNYGVGKIIFGDLSATALAKRNIERDYYSNIMNYLNTYSAYGQLIGEDL